MLGPEGRVFDGTRQVVSLRDEMRLSWLNRLGASPGWDVSAEVGCSQDSVPQATAWRAPEKPESNMIRFVL